MDKETLGNIKDVIDYLNGIGWKAPRVTVYRHINEKKLRQNEAGSFDVDRVLRYARKNLKHLPDTAEPIDGKENMIFSIPAVSAYLHSRGWHAPNETLYRHIKREKIKKNRHGAFDIVDVEKYARKYLKPLDIMNEGSLAMAGLFQKAFEKFIRIRAMDIVNFVSGNTEKTEELKLFLIEEAGQFFKMQSIDGKDSNHEIG